MNIVTDIDNDLEELYWFTDFRQLKATNFP